jgi:hypothetical protein
LGRIALSKRCRKRGFAGLFQKVFSTERARIGAEDARARVTSVVHELGNGSEA